MMDSGPRLSGVRSVLYNGSQMAGARLFGPVVRALYMVVLAGQLGPEVYGLLVYCQAWYLTFLPISYLGLGPLLAFTIGRDPGQGPDFVPRAMTLRLLASLAVAIISITLGFVVEMEATARLLLTIFGIALVGRSLTVFCEQVFLASERSRYILRQEVLFRPLEAACGCAILLLGGGVVAVGLLHAVVYWLQGLRGLRLIADHLFTLSLDWDWAALLRLLREGLIIGLAGLGSIWLAQGPLVIYRQFAVSDAALGQMALAMQLLGFAVIVPICVSGVATPVLSRTVARRDQKHARFIEAMCRLVLNIGAAGALAGTAAGPWLVQTVFGASFELTGQLLGPALWLVVPLAIGHSAMVVLVAQSRFGANLVCSVLGILALVGSIVPLVSALGPLGLLMAAGTGQSVWAVSSLAFLMSQCRIEVSRALLRSGVGVLLAIAAYWALQSFGPWWSWIGSIAALVGASFALGAVTPEERRGAIGLLRQLCGLGAKERIGPRSMS